MTEIEMRPVDVKSPRNVIPKMEKSATKNELIRLMKVPSKRFRKDEDTVYRSNSQYPE